METQTSPALLLGRYRTIELRDTGGFGSVLVCWDVRLQRRVAVKCLPLDAEGDAASVVDEALAEARASSFLTHPNIVTVHDFAVDDRYAYIVMEYVDGVTLAELMARVEGGVLIWCEVAHVLRSVAAALAYAHDNGVLHLDIKPANVMVARDGSVKLADFGMASIASAAGWGGARGGTVGYMPPEQLTGDLVDERTDVFALAAVCYEALTGLRPFEATTPAASLKLIEKGAPPLSDAEEGLGGPTTLAFQTALAPSPAGRMTDPEEFAGEVLPSLGDPDEGRDSIVSLLDDEGSDEELFDEGAWRALDPPGRRIPWLPAAAARLASAGCTAALAWQCAAPLAGLGPVAVVCLIVAAAVAGAAVPTAACAAGWPSPASRARPPASQPGCPPRPWSAAPSRWPAGSCPCASRAAERRWRRRSWRRQPSAHGPCARPWPASRWSPPPQPAQRPPRPSSPGWSPVRGRSGRRTPPPWPRPSPPCRPPWPRRAPGRPRPSRQGRRHSPRPRGAGGPRAPRRRDRCSRSSSRLWAAPWRGVWILAGYGAHRRAPPWALR